jgi:hypothetical protein
VRGCEGGARAEVFEEGGGYGFGEDALVGVEFESLGWLVCSGCEDGDARTSALGVGSV